MITLKNVSKTLGKHLVLDNINYTFENGMVYGLCGHNGSGKTMLLRAIAGLIVPDDGEIIIDGEKLHRDISFPPNAGIVIESMELLPKYNAFDNLRLLADIKKIASDEDIRKSLERVGLNSDLKVKKFSLGMKQRLNVAQAIFEKQNIILLDEPSNALDNDGVQLIYSIIKEEKQRGATVIVAFSGLKNVNNPLHRASAGGSLNPKELLDIAYCLRGLRTLDEWHGHSSGVKTSLDFFFHLS